MPEIIRENLRVALCETNPALRSAVQSALFKQGMREMEVCKDSSALITLLNAEIVDLVICATDLPGLDFCDLMQQIRHGTIGRNPFTLVLATIDRATQEEIRRIINAGVDRVIKKPFSMADINGCVNSAAAARRKFVASESYIGPSRRAAPRSDQGEDETLAVPNSFTAKLAGTVDDEALEPVIRASKASLSQLRTHNSCVALARSAKRVAQSLRSQRDRAAIEPELGRLMAMSEMLDRRYRGTAHENLSEIAGGLSLLAELFHTIPANSQRAWMMTVDLLQKMGDAIRQLDQENPPARRTVHEMVNSLKLFALTLRTNLAAGALPPTISGGGGRKALRC